MCKFKKLFLEIFAKKKISEHIAEVTEGEEIPGEGGGRKAGVRNTLPSQQLRNKQTLALSFRTLVPSTETAFLK